MLYEGVLNGAFHFLRRAFVPSVPLLASLVLDQLYLAPQFSNLTGTYCMGVEMNKDTAITPPFILLFCARRVRAPTAQRPHLETVHVFGANIEGVIDLITPFAGAYDASLPSEFMIEKTKESSALRAADVKKVIDKILV
jgi:hypothetical protein